MYKLETLSISRYTLNYMQSPFTSWFPRQYPFLSDTDYGRPMKPFWSLELLEAIQGIAFQCQNFVVNLLNFCAFHHVFISSLDMFKNCINSYHIDSEQVQTCLRIIWIITIRIILNLNKFRHVRTCSDMFENHINSYQIDSEQV